MEAVKKNANVIKYIKNPTELVKKMIKINLYDYFTNNKIKKVWRQIQQIKNLII